MWKFDDTYAEKVSIKKFQKRHAADFDSCMRHLHSVYERLQEGYDFRKECDLKYVHNEGKGLIGIGQKRTASSVECRLYIYIDSTRKIIYVFGIGDKSCQKRDVPRFQKIIRELILNDDESKEYVLE